MINMFRADFYRLTKSKGFYIFWVLSVATFLISVICKSSGGISFGAPLVFSEDIKMDVEQVARNFTYYFFLIMPVFGIIASEFSEHTVKNTITSSIGKSKYFISKYLFTLLYSLLSFLTINYLFYFINRAVNGSEYSSSIGDYSKAFFGQFPVFVAIVSLFIFIAFLVRKGAAFNAVTIITPVVYTSASLVLYGIESTRKLSEKLLTYEISNMISQLALNCGDSYRIKCYIISAAIAILSFVFGYLLFNKREID